uniref:Uncharacterized protein n=1 Tax=Pseudo-nitzschia australis TaxID=44445 RepID=A0A6V0DLM9_9STRA|mmetsp:Transcript_9638/g.20885  ORF Transcript_9638/g.20885 Transcript_9638/m.20885 type:complete len:583 (-) Transcript_9638:1952-3700(-)|eukprot:CAMPEP_0168199212 /NCGR_PEP_ID=MMETSP0139_2-20121125/22275_1 /TAXON_ID=44445 /ORGANISM="Pseudo-nitzschia australis, Strain 10249 10 AB" /LENGTH=582 /DNA_ID=CAMNT_0008124131 /DNA_START=78 /DNA_END=1826 /DNA_ORIENTATION=-
MVDGKGSSVSSGPFEDRSPEHSRKYRDGFRNRLLRLRQYNASSTQGEVEETEARDGQSKEILKPTQSLIKPPLSSREKQRIVRSKSYKGNTETVASSSKPTGNRRDGNDNLMRHHFPLPQEMIRENEKISPPNHTISNSIISLAERRDEEKPRASFHVRISIGYMTGLKIDKVNKRTKQPTNNRITVGFVELASSGKYTALSQPLLTNVEEKVKTSKILWANQRDGEDVSKSKARRRLHFSLQLEREDVRDENEDVAFKSQASFAPEVVKLLVGLKCGDERIPLGIAKLVVNGKEIVEQKIDLVVLPIPCPANGPKGKRSIFGKKQMNTFIDGDLTYKLSQSATLRVKAEIKIGSPGQDGAEIWGNEESSCTTKWTFDAGSALYCSSPPTCGLNFSTAPVPPVKGVDEKTRSKKFFKQKPQIAERIENSIHTGSIVSPHGGLQQAHRVPVPFISTDSSNELVSVLSGMSDTGCDSSWSCSPICCGHETSMSKTRYGRLFPGSFSFESSQVLENELDFSNNESRAFDVCAESSWNYARTFLSGNTTQTNKYRRPSTMVEETDGGANDDFVHLGVSVETSEESI